METESTRQQKVARQLQKDLSEIFQQQGMGVYNGAMISVTGVRISPDLSFAKVFVSIFPSSKTESVMKIISQNAKFIRMEMGKRVKNQLRMVPEIAFNIDDSLDYVEKIESLLKK
ncbi:MAG: 30S ribosome-binding factor RbfA [Prevotellaceae bacterium]|jgi:ribosome-binding factor A|nr:30S ribosome-binding factor RbfA [Prevotellaceae bacterium]